MANQPQDKPSERTWTIPCGVTTEDGKWLPQPGMLSEGLVELQATLSRIGGVAQLGTVRARKTVVNHVPAEEMPTQDEMATTSVWVRWQSYVPAQKVASSPPPESEAPES